MSFPELDGHAEDQPPPYEESWSFPAGETPSVQDGRINVELGSKVAASLYRWSLPAYEEALEAVESETSDAAPVDISWDTPLNIVIQVVGSRGDVQPFVALGTELRKYGHRVRLATHGTFEQFVLQAGLEFYPIGGDPTQLMAYMVKNPGLIPSMKTLREGEIQRKRNMIGEMLNGCWKSCVEPDPQTQTPFVAQAIIANPVSFAHVHCAQALSIPVHLMFTMPWTSTRAFPHPLANIKDSNHEPRMANYLSYGMVQWMTWQGGVVNTWRKSMDLEPVPTSEGPFIESTLKIPYTYCWSAALVPKPNDWPKHIDVCGFFFREMPSYNPPADLANFLASGPPPVYIGFGSIVIDDPTHLTKVLLEAVRISGVRALISRGWSKIGEPHSNQNIFYLEDCPHEWLFQRVSAVVHHGGAGTTACGLLNARPTVVVPFFGDQPFWGQMIANAKAGPPPIPHKEINENNLADALKFCLTAEAANAAKSIAGKMQDENGVACAVASFHRQLPRERMGCEVLPRHAAVWLYTKGKRPMRLSSLAAEHLCLARDLKFKRKHLKHYGPSPFIIQRRRWDPVTGASSASIKLAYNITSSTTGIFTDPAKVYLDKSKQDGSEETSQLKLHGQAALASAKSTNRLAVGAFKGGMVDVPLALAEGFRNAPRLWGEDVKEQQEINGWKSGAAVAGKSFAYGMYDGVGGFFYKPYVGAKKEGLTGFAKGCGKSVSGIALQPVSGAFGIFGYAGDGIAKSLDRAVHAKTQKHIVAAKHSESEHSARRERLMVADAGIVQTFCERSKVSTKGKGKGKGKGKEREVERATGSNRLEQEEEEGKGESTTSSPVATSRVSVSTGHSF